MTFHSMDTLDIGVIMSLSRYPAYQKSERVEDFLLCPVLTFTFLSTPLPISYINKTGRFMHSNYSSFI